MCAVISRDRLPQVVQTVWIFWFTGLLRIVARPPQITVKQPGCYFVALNRCQGGHVNEDFSAIMMSRPINCPGSNFGLEDWRNRLRFSSQTALYPIELDRIQRWH